GIATRGVSMPCIELFEEQSQDYKNEVLPPNVTARLAIEAGVRQGWDRYVGPKGDVICLDRFGASSPGDVALKNLGFNIENVLKHARALRRKVYEDKLRCVGDRKSTRLNSSHGSSSYAVCC